MSSAQVEKGRGETAEVNALQVGTGKADPLEPSSLANTVADLQTCAIGRCEIRLSELAALKLTRDEDGIAKVTRADITIGEACVDQGGILQYRLGENYGLEPNVVEVGEA